jgi:hypothetical protein
LLDDANSARRTRDEHSPSPRNNYSAYFPGGSSSKASAQRRNGWAGPGAS